MRNGITADTWVTSQDKEGKRSPEGWQINHRLSFRGLFTPLRQYNYSFNEIMPGVCQEKLQAVPAITPKLFLQFQ